MSAIAELEELLEARFAEHLAAIDPATPPHRVEFSGRITESWALIYYRRNLVRLSPYLFLLDPTELKHGSHWRELDATLRHEAAHASAFHSHDHTGHGAPFHAAVRALGLRTNGACDLGPENAAFRYVYACPTCAATWHRRARLTGNASCGECSPGRYSPEHRLVLREERDLSTRLAERRDWARIALADGRRAMGVAPAPRLAPTFLAPSFHAPVPPS